MELWNRCPEIGRGTPLVSVSIAPSGCARPGKRAYGGTERRETAPQTVADLARWAGVGQAVEPVGTRQIASGRHRVRFHHAEPVTLIERPERASADGNGVARYADGNGREPNAEL
jgi:hypothetical protein